MPFRPNRRPGKKPFERKQESYRDLDIKAISKRLLVYVGESKKTLYIIFAIVICSAMLSSVKPAVLGKIIDELNTIYQTKTFHQDTLLYFIAILCGTSALASLGQYAQGFFSARFTKELITRLREDVFKAIGELPIAYTDSHSHGDLMSRLVNDTDSVVHVLSQTISSLFSNIISIISITAVMLYFSPIMTLVLYIFVPLTVFIGKKLSRRMRYYSKYKYEAIGVLEGNIEENISAYETLLAYNQRASVKDSFDNANETYKKFAIKSGILGNLVNPLLAIMSGLTYVAVALIGSILVINNSISIGVIQTFLLYIRQLTAPLNGLTSMYTQIQSAFAAANRIFDILDAAKEKVEGEKYDHALSASIDIKGLSFSYKPNQPVLEDFSLHINEGEKIAIVGETGSGKTSLINVLMRFYPYAEGEITLGNKSLNDYDLHYLRKNIALVLQDPFIFSGTIKENIAYGCGPKTDEEIIEAAKSANAHDFIMQLPENYDTVIGNEGSSVSVGQRQLICLARTFIKNAPILILDEATANIDTLTEIHIQNAIFKLMEKKTCIVIAHRLSTIVSMDRVIVLDKGKIVEEGCHESLLALNGVYHKLYTCYQ